MNGNNINNIEFNKDKIWINLKLISKLKPNEKLQFDYSESLFSIDNNIIKCITRYYYGYNRTDIINIIDKLITNTFECIDKLNKNKVDKNYYNILIKYINELNNVIEGLINLKITYNGDQLIQSKLDYIIEKIHNIISDNIIKND